MSILVLYATEQLGFGHGRAVHAAISHSATISSSRFAHFLEDNIGLDYDLDNSGYSVFRFDSQKRTAYTWIEQGSRNEDDGTRYFNHFYRPVPAGKKYLTDPIDYSGFGYSDSFKRASDDRGNDECWTKARQYELDGLINPSKQAREASLGHMFEALGHVIHLNQDLSQPGHTRNDAHPIKTYIETYGAKVYLKKANTPPYPDLFPASSMTLDQWQADGFTKLEDFWNRYLYKGQSQPLIDNENPAPTNPKKLGLAEFSNGNFLSEDALYAELYKPGGTHYAPLPSILTGTDYVLVRDNPFEGTDYELFADQISRQRLFLIKGEGVPVLHHSVLSYLGVRFPVFNPSTLIQYGVSIDSPAVLNDYLTILIPKAIEYSTGILDYFFRGRVQLIVTFNSDPAPGDGHYGLQIIDISGVGQDFHAGTYALYSDDLSGLRTAVTFPYVTYPDSGATGTFDVPSGTRANYTILYRGIIGSDGYDEVLDPVDASSAIAAKQFHILRLNIVPEPATLDDLDVDVYLVDPFGEIVYFDHPSSNMGANIDQDGGTIGPYSFQGNITLGNVVDGDYQVWVNYHSEGDVSLHSAATVTLNTFFNSQDPLTSETFTLVSPNGGSNRPIGIAGPATQASWYIRRLIKIRNGQLTQY